MELTLEKIKEVSQSAGRSMELYQKGEVFLALGEWDNVRKLSEDVRCLLVAQMLERRHIEKPSQRVTL